jgi:hypothetical protein
VWPNRPRGRRPAATLRRVISSERPILAAVRTATLAVGLGAVLLFLVGAVLPYAPNFLVIARGSSHDPAYGQVDEPLVLTVVVVLGLASLADALLAALRPASGRPFLGIGLLLLAAAGIGLLSHQLPDPDVRGHSVAMLLLVEAAVAAAVVGALSLPPLPHRRLTASAVALAVVLALVLAGAAGLITAEAVRIADNSFHGAPGALPGVGSTQERRWTAAEPGLA